MARTSFLYCMNGSNIKTCLPLNPLKSQTKLTLLTPTPELLSGTPMVCLCLNYLAKSCSYLIYISFYPFYPLTSSRNQTDQLLSRQESEMFSGLIKSHVILDLYNFQ